MTCRDCPYCRVVSYNGEQLWYWCSVDDLLSMVPEGQPPRWCPMREGG